MVLDGTDVARDADALAWAVRVAARRVPRASCLTQSLALETMLTLAGLPAETRIGVARKTDGAFEAHAWVVHQGRVLLGGLPDMDRFTELASADRPEGRP